MYELYILMRGVTIQIHAISPLSLLQYDIGQGLSLELIMQHAVYTGVIQVLSIVAGCSYRLVHRIASIYSSVRISPHMMLEE